MPDQTASDAEGLIGRLRRFAERFDGDIPAPVTAKDLRVVLDHITTLTQQLAATRAALTLCTGSVGCLCADVPFGLCEACDAALAAARAVEAP